MMTGIMTFFAELLVVTLTLGGVCALTVLMASDEKNPDEVQLPG